MRRRLLSGLAAAGLATTFAVVATAPAAAKGGEVGGTGDAYFLSNSFSATADVTFRYGRATDQVYIGDWDGNGTDTIAVRRGSTFYINNSTTGGAADQVFTYGRRGDVVLVGDWNGDGKDTLAVRRGKEYHVKNSLTGGDADKVIRYGRPDDTILVGDWDGDGEDSFAVRRGQEYHVKNAIAGGHADEVVRYGRADDEVLVGDWDRDGEDSFAVRRGNRYYIANEIRGGSADFSVTFGRATDTALAGDWNGDGRDTLGLRRDGPIPSTPPPTGPSSDAEQALRALGNITVTTREAGGYERSEFGSGWWQRDGCNTRHTILQRDFLTFTLNDNCVVQTGTLDDPYTGQRLNYSSSSPNSIQIDHVVPVSAAWKMGANSWTYQERREFYNDHDNLLAVHGPTNASKGDKTLGQWQPPNEDFHCEYTITYIEVTDDWDLSLKPIDVDYAEELLPTC